MRRREDQRDLIEEMIEALRFYNSLGIFPSELIVGRKVFEQMTMHSVTGIPVGYAQTHESMLYAGCPVKLDPDNPHRFDFVIDPETD